MQTTNMALKVVATNKTGLENEAITNGSIYFVSDTKEIYVDYNNTRTCFEDIIILNNDSQRESILFAPLNKFYYALDTNKLYLYKDGVWYTITSDLDGYQTLLSATNKLNADYIQDGSTNKVVTSTEKNSWNNKQNTISDLSTIRSGASKGATSVQPDDLADVAFSGDYTDLTNKPTIPTVGNGTITIQKNGVKVDDFTLNSSSNKNINITVPIVSDIYNSTSSDGMSGKAVASAISNKADKSTTLSGYGITNAYTKTEIDGKLTGAFHYKGSKASESALPSTGNEQGDVWNVSDTGANYAWNGTSWDKLSETYDFSIYTIDSTLATVAKSGLYSDLTGRPTINDATLTIQKNGTPVATFTANSAEAKTANITITSSDITSALNYTPYDSSNPDGYIKASDLPDSTSLSYYGTCATAASTQAKIVDCAGFELKTGVSIRVKFTNNQTYNGQATLNVNSTGAKGIVTNGTTKAVRYCWIAGEVVSFTYDGTNYIMEDAGIASTSYYGYTKLATSATSTNTDSALTPATINSVVQNMIEPYPVYSTSATYAVGDRVRYSYQAWECITAITTAEAWNAEHWQAIDPIQIQIDGKVNSADLAAVATSGSFNDLTNKPDYLTGEQYGTIVIDI